MSKSKFYTEKEMVQELKEVLIKLGCEIEEIDIDKKIFKIHTDDSSEVVGLVIDDIVNKYKTKRLEVLSSNPFCGVYDIVEELHLGDYDEQL